MKLMLSLRVSEGKKIIHEIEIVSYFLNICKNPVFILISLELDPNFG